MLPWALFIAVFAFLLASFPARNSDLWIHLAAGRQWAGEPFGPGAPGAPGAAGQGWLFDLICYGIYSTAGGPGLVLAKALVVVGLALLLLRLGQTGLGWSLAGTCTVLALLAMGTRLLLQPSTISYFMLALTLWLILPGPEPRADVRRINRPPADRPPADRPPALLPPWPLLILFVIWANLDHRFVLGLGTVGLVWLGRILDEVASPSRLVDQKRAEARPTNGVSRLQQLSRRVFSFAVLSAVCLVNPSHVHAFGLPPELGWLGFAEASALPPAWKQVASPFQGAYLNTVGLSPAGLAYFPLLGLGLLSFVLNLRHWSWERFLPWLGLALLSGFQARAIPFFAVVAGPVLAWNLQEVLARRNRRGAQLECQSAIDNRQSAIKFLTVVLGLGLLVCAWPGWLQVPPYEPRRWAIELPPSLERGAAVVRRWHQQGKLSSDVRGLHLSPETADVFAWHCPEEKGVRDDRLSSAILGAPDALDDRSARLRAFGIKHVIVYNADRVRLLEALDRLLADPVQWPLIYLEGDLAVFGWRDPSQRGGADPFQGWELDLNQLAFRPALAKRAPRTRPDQKPEPRSWWHAFWRPARESAGARPVDRDEAILHLLHAEALRRSAPARHRAAWEACQSTALAGAASVAVGPALLLDVPLRLVLVRPMPSRAPEPPARGAQLERWAFLCRTRFSLQRDDTPPALLYLAVRAARRALAVNSADARAHLVLGECYLRWLHNTRERAWGSGLKELVQLRQAQASVALNDAVVLKPDLAQAHLNLGWLYREMGYLDLALKHLRTHFDLVNKAGPPAGLSAERFRQQLDDYDSELNRLARVVDDEEKSYAAESPGLRILDRALLAVRKGLAGKARDLLLESDIAAFGRKGMELELELLLLTGRWQEVRDWTGVEQQLALGPVSYHWLRAQALAASGDYALAEDELAQLASGSPGRQAAQRDSIALLIGKEVLDQQPAGATFLHFLWQARHDADFQIRLQTIAGSLRQEADATVLRGLLALEKGEVDEAKAAFRAALAFGQDNPSPASAGRLFNGRAIAQGCLQWLE